MKKQVINLLLLISVTIFQVTLAAGMDKGEVKRIIIQEAQKERVSPALALAVAKVGSDFQHYTLGIYGERGVMQLPRIGQQLTMEENVSSGVKKLAKLMRAHRQDTERALEEYKEGWVIGMTPEQVDRFVEKVLRWEMIYHNQQITWNNGILNRDRLTIK